MQTIFCITNRQNLTNVFKKIHELLVSVTPKVYLKIISEDKAKTEAQNNTFHALLQCFYTSGQSSFDSYDQMKKHYKYHADIIQEYLYFNGETFISVSERSDIPQGTPKEHTRAVIGSWSTGGKKKCSKAIDLLLMDMRNAGVNNKEFETIMEGMNHG